jgi:hypothetical protein
MASSFAVTAALGDMSFDRLLLILLTLVIVTTICVMGRTSLDYIARKLVAHYMVVGLVILILVALVMGEQRGYGTESQRAHPLLACAGTLLHVAAAPLKRQL